MILTPCIEYQGERNWAGYGRQWRNNRRYQAHRLAYCDAHGIDISEIDGLMIRHKCDNPPCVNPDHLETGSHADNMRDMRTRGRANTARGNRLPHTLPPDKVAEIKAMLATGVSQRTIAARCGVGQSTVSRILNDNRNH